MSTVAVHAAVTAPVPPESLFGVLTDWPRHAEWMPFTRAEGGNAVGERLEAWTGIGPVGFLDTMVITDWRPGRRVAVLHTGKVVRGEAWFEITPGAGDHSRIVWAEKVELPFGPVGRVGWLVVGPVVRAFMGLGLRRLARLAAAEDVGAVR